MPTFAWLIDDGENGLKMSQPLPHTCFANAGYMPQRSYGYGSQPKTSHFPEVLYTYYVASFLNYDDTKLWADAINGCECLQDKVRFVLKAHPHDDPDNPFANDKLQTLDPWGKKPVPIHPTYCPSKDVNYWSISFQEGEVWDYVYATFKLLFKNITYGNRGEQYGDIPEEMIKFLKQGATLFETIIYAGAFLGNGYNYPCKIKEDNIKAVMKFIKEGPCFPDYGSLQGLSVGERLGSPDKKYAYGIGANHNPVEGPKVYVPDPSIGGNNKPVTVEEFRKQLNKLAGVS